MEMIIFTKRKKENRKSKDSARKIYLVKFAEASTKLKYGRKEKGSGVLDGLLASQPHCVTVCVSVCVCVCVLVLQQNI